MHETLVIFKKDVRRLWWQIAIALLLLAALGHQDAWRADALPDSLEGWLNLLVPFAWACLIAQVIHEETMVGDREFWMTRPYRWPSLLAAKALFVLLFVHLPSFVADVYIIAARGLSPSEALPHLLWKQLLLAGGLTIPAIALAAIVRNLMQFVFVAVLAPVVVMFSSTSIRFPIIPVDRMRSTVTIFVLALVTIAIVFLQYRSRRSRLTRILGISGGLLAGALYAFIPPADANALQAAAFPEHRNVTLAIAPAPAQVWINGGPNTVNVGMLLTASGVPPDLRVRADSSSVEVAGPNGAHYRSSRSAVYRPLANVEFDGAASTYWNEPSPAIWLRMTFTRAAFDRIKNGPVTVFGSLAVQFYRLGQTIGMPVGASRDVSGVGRCSSTIQQWWYSDGLLKVLCESATADPIYARIDLQWPGRPPQRGLQRLGDIASDVPGPRVTWLSPVERRQTSFQLAQDRPETPQSNWLVPKDALPSAEIVITPELVTGYQIVNYRFSNLDLKDYIMRRPRQ